MIGGIFNRNKTVTASIEDKTTTFIDGIVSNTYASVGSAECIYYRGKPSDRVVSEQLRAEIEFTFIFNPRAIDETLMTDTSRIVIVGIGTFSVVARDNVAGQDKALIVYGKKYNG